MTILLLVLAILNMVCIRSPVLCILRIPLNHFLAILKHILILSLRGMVIMVILYLSCRN